MDYLELLRDEGPLLMTLEAERVSIGRSPFNDIPLTSDPRVSRQHAVLEHAPAGWSVRDLGSSNGTFVNGRRILGECALRSGDELRVGTVRIVLRSDEAGQPREITISGERLPELTRRERDVLIALCASATTGGTFTEPASIRQIARTLYVSEAAIKQHLLRLYDKFGIHGEGERRRVQLANEAIRRGAVTAVDLREARPSDRASPST